MYKVLIFSLFIFCFSVKDAFAVKRDPLFGFDDDDLNHPPTHQKLFSRGMQEMAGGALLFFSSYMSDTYSVGNTFCSNVKLGVKTASGFLFLLGLKDVIDSFKPPEPVIH